MSMSDDKRIKLENTDSPSMNEDGHEQRRNWKEWLKYICDYNSGNNTHHMLNMDVEDGELSGVVKMGNEVIEVRYERDEDEDEDEDEIEVLIVIVNMENHSMRVLMGIEGEELVEMDLSELKENRIIDLNDEGRRWEGEVLEGMVFGYGRLYDEDNRLEYEGWMIGEYKRCYGTEYWNDLGTVKYRGCYDNGVKHGYGILYNRKGDIEYEGLFYYDDVVSTTLQWNNSMDLSIHSHIESLIINDFTRYISSLSLTWPLMSLKRLDINECCFNGLNQFLIEGLNELESVIIGGRSFFIDDEEEEGSRLVIMNCDKLKEIKIGDVSFEQYKEFVFKNLSSLQSMKIGFNSCRWYHSIVFESEND